MGRGVGDAFPAGPGGAVRGLPAAGGGPSADSRAGVGGVVGGTMGRSFSRRMDNKAVDKLFFWLLLVITGISVYNLIRCFV